MTLRGGILHARNLEAYYVLDFSGTRRIVKAVNQVDLVVYENEIFGIAGESGCGKTTLLKVLFAQVDPPLRIMNGQVFYRLNGEDVDVFTLPPEKKRRLRFEYIAYIPQGSMSVFNPVRTIRVTFLDVLESHVQGKAREELLKTAQEHLEKLGLSAKVLSAYPHQLSGGMRQRIAIALATLLSPRIILADEPTTALDVVAQRAVLDLLRGVQEKLKNTLILVTHDMGIHAAITHRMAVMYAGKIVEEGKTEDIFSSPLHPYTQYLIRSLPRIGDKTPRESVPGAPPSLVNLPQGCAFHPRCPHAFTRCREETPNLIPLGERHKVACFLRGG
ncbi:ABC transporter ATP-binding protein [Candidatus Caldatribacterium sp.]|uniref:ABC transporter ATP-binding protein n=1 Tax=Candidatus Caldatribacterium sp. TaxID=2282143 RepID=UPI002993A976|nr:ABC transporter ATP-binding protein [Candidatus Caldatribacterium sp.]MDW8081638.1 ABC transporter ATP-binding protein [Candidatus Calescibacterium sp.]